MFCGFATPLHSTGDRSGIGTMTSRVSISMGVFLMLIAASECVAVRSREMLFLVPVLYRVEIRTF